MYGYINVKFDANNLQYFLLQ